jgi:GT2 family glycosyltransferase
VDNGSNDNTVAQARVHLPQALIIENGRNLGFGAANNRALERVTTPYAFLLNPDCDVDASRLAQLVEVAHANPEAAIVAPHLLRADGSPEVNYRWPSTTWTSRGPAAEGLCNVGFACGAALLFNMVVMRDVGFFDEEFFLYYEDDDLCTRVFNRKLPILLAPAIRLMHHSRGSVRGNSPLRAEYLRGYHHAQSKILFARKYKGAQAAEQLLLRTSRGAFAHVVLRALVPSPRLLWRAWGRLQGLRHMQHNKVEPNA